MKVGSLVECIDDNFSDYDDGETFPIKGEIYTVRDVLDEYESIRLEEIINPIRYYGTRKIECAFFIRRFRELQPPCEINIEELIEEYA